jgi:hypothetical protein
MMELKLLVITISVFTMLPFMAANGTSGSIAVKGILVDANNYSGIRNRTIAVAQNGEKFEYATTGN